ncbi:MAG: cytochrome C [Gemmatimonadetes bacterium]|nr:cytochrome C [Gemmatimonadota bacterium]
MPHGSRLVLALAALFAAASPAASQRGAALPAGEGQQIVQATCGACHGLGNIAGSAGYDEAGWRSLFATMVALPDAQARTVASYLAKNFPAKTARRPTLMNGEVQVDIDEWMAPTLGQRVRDPLQARDGAIWWTGMFASLVGRMDPNTGEMREFKLPEGTRPHGIAEDPQGNIWFTGNGNGTVGRLDPRTGETKVYKTQARDPHTPLVHPNGNLYFTAQGARMMGRIDLRTGELKEVPTPAANPYGLKVDKSGRLWIAFNGPALDRPGGQPVSGAMIASMDPETMEFRVYDMPDPESQVRRLDLASDGTVWFVNSARGRIGKLDPRTGAVKEWESPSGPASHPYAIAVVDDVVWYNESNQRPDVLVRFDPRTEKFQSFPIPSGFGIIRNMFVTKEGDLLIHQSSSNRFGRVKVRPPKVQEG